MRCELCQKRRDDPNDMELFGALTDCNGKTWRICGKCIQVMWRKRAPKPGQM